MTVNDSTLDHNAAYFSGGGIENYQGTVTVSDSTLENNSVSLFNGGGIDNYSTEH